MQLRNNQIGIAIVLILSLFSSCKEFEQIQVSGVKGFQIHKMGMDGIEGDVLLNIKNPNSIGFSIYPSEFDIVFSGIKMGKAKLKKRVHIDANCEKTYAFTLNSSFKGLNIMDIAKFLSGSKLGKIEVTGNLKVGKLFVRKTIPVNVTERINLGG